MSKKTELNDKHWKALGLLENGMLRKNVATAVGWKRDYLDKLCVGNTQVCGKGAILFKAEYLKIQKKHAEETTQLVADNMKKAQELIGEVFAEIKGKKKKTDADKKILSMYTNAIAKCQPGQGAKNVSFSYTKGLTAEELIHEFKRLKTVAESSFERGGISETPEGRERDISGVDE